MADQGRGSDGPSLELPSLRFGRRKRAKQAQPEQEPAPDTRQDTAAQPTPPAAAQEPAPVTDEAPTVAAPPPAVSEPTRAPVPEPAPEETRPLFTDEVAPAPLAPPRPRRAARTQAEPETATLTPGEQAPAPAPATGRSARRARTRRAPSLPVLGGMAAAVLTGAVIGLATVGLTWGSQRTCEAARGTSSCGAAGFWLLVAIMVAMVLLGAALLRAWRVPDPGSTSFLAVGLLAVLALLFLVDVLFSRWMLLVIPLLTVLTYALAHWVTSTFVEPERD